MEEKKSKTTIIQMLIKNQNHLNKVDLESNSTKKFEVVTRKSNRKQSICKTDELKCSNWYETLYTDDNDDETCNSYNSSTSSDGSTSPDEISGDISSGNMQKEKNRKISTKRKEIKRTKILSLKERMKLVKKERVIYIYIKIGITISLKHLSKEYNQLLVVLLRKNARK